MTLLIVALVWFAMGGLANFLYYSHFDHMHRTEWTLLKREEVFDAGYYVLQVFTFLIGPAGLVSYPLFKLMVR